MRGRVVVCYPGFAPDEVRALLDGAAVVETGPVPTAGDDVVALLVGPEVPVDSAAIARLPGLRVVATCSVGYDHIDVPAAAAAGVVVTNVPDYCVEEMADSSLALVLALLRGVVELDRSVRGGRWDWTSAGPLRRIAGTRLGVIGFGRIGRALAARAQALGMEVWAHDPLVGDAAVTAAGARPATLDDLLAACHAVSLHVPLTPASEGMIGRRELARMPAGAVLVNTARGRLLDHDALLEALASGHLGGAALDVLPVEPPTGDHPAPAAPNLVVTPHAAYYSEEADRAAYTRPVLAVRAVLEGREPDGRVPAPQPAP
jgi:D-3-phosphoglycerate dehydrogenase / 2-oxoglutarate reductase